MYFLDRGGFFQDFRNASGRGLGFVFAILLINDACALSVPLAHFRLEIGSLIQLSIKVYPKGSSRIPNTLALE